MPDTQAGTAERRLSQRVPAVHRAAVLDKRGHALALGRTSNLSADGVLLILPWREELASAEELVVELELPKVAHGHVRRGQRRKVRYRGRVVRTQEIGQLLGVGLHFIEKLA